MRRRHLFEFNDLGWFPQSFRDALTAFLGVLERRSKPYHAVHRRIFGAIRSTGRNAVVDLCTGNGVSALALRESAVAEEMGLEWLLTDLFPTNSPATFPGQNNGTEVVYLRRPINACAPTLDGYQNAFRTIFTAFHHFRPEDAARVLQSAVDARAGIAVCEFTHRSFGNCLKYLATPLLVCLVMSRIRPIRWDWLFFTFVIPILPLAIAWDGMVSNLRSYSAVELQGLVDSVSGHAAYHWEIGVAGGPWMFPTITYLIGSPEFSFAAATVT
ncbi:MAG TPA: hypothetical protein VGP76_27845 [Planctomycetaceae bacterium]|jgi:hypothetical protein|nr:hypothetical protein [Planctomycetaceae bacterium]